jgi:hypothetical protein
MNRDTWLFRFAISWLSIVAVVLVFALFKSWG